MAKRDYHKEYERDKKSKKNIGVQVTPDFFNEFTKIAEANGTNKNAVLKLCAEAYTSGKLIIDEDGRMRLIEEW